MPTQKKILTFIFCLLAAITNGYIFNFINNKYFHYSSNQNGLSEFSATTKFLIIVIIAPIVETAIFNLLPNKLLKHFRLNNNLLLIIIPSIVFSLFHLYNTIYFLMALIGGLITNWYFLNSHKRAEIAFWLVALLHATYNLYGYLFVN